MKRGSVGLVFNIFLVIGLLCLTGTFLICYNIKKFNNAAVKTNGTVVDLLAKDGRRSVSYTPVVNYTDAGGHEHRYIPSFSSNPPGFSIGEKVGVYYNPKNPDEAKLDGWGEYIGAMILGGLGLVFSLIGAGYHVVRRLNRSRNDRLKQSGELVQADFITVDVNRNVYVNNTNPFFIRCEWKDQLTGKKRKFKSGFIWSDPTPYIELHRKMDVYIDRKNTRRYYVDISFLDNWAPDKKLN